MNLFGPRKKTSVQSEPAAGVAQAGLNKSSAMMEKRMDFLAKTIEKDKQEVLKSLRAKDKRKAKMALKRQKMNEARYDKLSNQKMNLDVTKNAIADMAITKDVTTSLATANTVLKSETQGVLNKAEDVMEDLTEQLADLNDIGDVLAQPGLDGLDEFELDEELDSLEAELLDGELVGTETPIAAPATATPVTPAREPALDFPEAPAVTDEDRELRELEASMAM